MHIDLTPIFQAFIALLAALITTKLIPWIKSKTTEQQQANIHAAAKLAVFAAEQIYGANKGDEKLAYALQALEAAGFHLDETSARTAIEDAVHTMNINPFSIPAIAVIDEEPDEDPTFQDTDEPIPELAEAGPGDIKAPPDGE